MVKHNMLMDRETDLYYLELTLKNVSVSATLFSAWAQIALIDDLSWM